MTETFFLAANYRAIGLTITAIVAIGFVVLFIRNINQAKPELGSEIELAANRRPYLSDEELEGPKLDKSLSFALVTLGICSLAIPFYWLAEPGRQDGAVDAYQLSFESRGEDLYVAGAQCVNCHSAGGVGGGAAYVLQDADGQFVANAQWNAPALDDLFLRYDEEEVRYILNYGRPDSPMAAWGTPGGGPLTTQQVQNIMEYIETFQMQSLDAIAINESEDAEVAQAAADEIEDAIRAEIERSIEAGEFESVGEAVFNLGLFSDFRNGSLSCGRCHTAGWSLGADTVPTVLDEGVAGCGGGSPSGIGYNLCDGGTLHRFPDDTWKLPDGSWQPVEGLTTDDGEPYLLSMDGEQIMLSAKGEPVTGEVDEEGEPVPYLVIEDGDLAECAWVSSLWEPEVGPAYPFDPDVAVVYDEEAHAFVDPEPLDSSDFPDGLVLEDGRIVTDCTIIDMPERTSQAHYDFVYNGADAGAGYGSGGQSHGGMMPEFGQVLPPDLIQAVVDYERGL